ncbi:hypothetical protein EDC04DRAFT_2910550 [Pisolithus marmoratus]|nr:hypothetical protein EDC04DRAFT_2910550 [Pisolithus marmoratus]
MAYRGKEIRIAIMGATGSGKSTFINSASGSDLPVGKGLESCTADVRTSKPFLLNGRIVTLIDTPGFDDTTRSDTDILSSIAAYLSNTYEHGAKLAGVIYMHRISDFRMGGTSKRNFRLFRELCGDNSLKNVTIVTNMWGNVDPKIGEAREKELATNDKFFKPVLEKGARMMRHHGTQASAHTILRYLVNGQAATLAIQHELVNERKDLAHTAAGAELARALKEQEVRHDEELKKLRVEMEAAMRSKDEETRQELQEEVDKKRVEVERIKHDAERMVETFNAEKARLVAKIAEMEKENCAHIERMQGLQGKIEEAHEQIEVTRREHVRRQTEIIEAHKQEDERKAHLLEQERLSRERAEAQHREHVLELQHEMARAEEEKKKIEAEQLQKIKAEQERAAALAAELEKQAKIREEEERARRQKEEEDKAQLQKEIAKAQDEMKRITEEQGRKEREAAAAKKAQEDALDQLREQQRLAAEREKEEHGRRVAEEVERAKRTLQEEQAKMEKENTTRKQAEEVRIREQEEQLARLREEEARRMKLEEELHRERRAKDEALLQAEQARLASESAAATRAVEEAQARIAEERRVVLEREEVQRKQFEEEMQKVRRSMEEKLSQQEREAAVARREREEARAREIAAQEKAIRLVEEQRKKEAEEQLTRLRSQISEAEALRKQMAAETAEREAAERKRNAELQEELAKARREAENARTALRTKEPSPSLSLPIPFVVWRAAMAWFGAR